ncbi:TPA: hypothetical protein QHR60_004049 [Escherichia coli]|nr:hypothetical protein [Escherichia coli]
MNNFKKNHEAFFMRVCAFLGDNWRIDKRDTACDERIVMLNPELRGYQIVARLEKNRFSLVGFCRRGNVTSSSSCCTASPRRTPFDLAEFIKRRLICTAEKQCDEILATVEKAASDKQERLLLLHLLSKTVDVTPYQSYYNVICGIKAKKLTADIKERSKGMYELKINDLSFEQILRLAGLLATFD